MLKVVWNLALLIPAELILRSTEKERYLFSFLYWLKDLCCLLGARSMRFYLTVPLLYHAKHERILRPCVLLGLYAGDWKLWASCYPNSKCDGIFCRVHHPPSGFKLKWTCHRVPFRRSTRLLFQSHRNVYPVCVQQKGIGIGGVGKRSSQSIVYTQNPRLLKIKCQIFKNLTPFLSTYYCVIHSLNICFCLH